MIAPSDVEISEILRLCQPVDDVCCQWKWILIFDGDLIKSSVVVAVLLRATTKQGKRWVNCQDVSQSAQGGDKSRRTCQTLQSILECMSFVQGPIEMSHSGQERGVKEDKLDCYCVNCGVYIHAVLSTY